ncbi:MAG: response regulator [Myxococcales bacterium]|nr:response regulator [Myxococcales bacterium]
MNQKKILIADDDPDILEQVSLLLKGEGYQVLGAHSQEEAEEALLTAIPDLAIFDLMMENKDSGFVLCHHVKRLYPETPVIILTAVAAATGLNFSSPSPEVRSWIKADTFLNKPVRPEQLRAEVHRLLDR